MPVYYYANQKPVGNQVKSCTFDGNCDGSNYKWIIHNTEKPDGIESVRTC